MNEKFDFPFGFHIGTLLIGESYEIPLILSEQAGGFCVLYDNDEEENALEYIEIILLHFAENLPINLIEYNIFDYRIKKRFTTLSRFKSDGLYKIYYKSQDANNRFAELENIAFKRSHEILGDKFSIVHYNKTSKYKEKFYVLVINIEHFPDGHSSYKNVLEFFEASYEVGFFIIFYASKLNNINNDIKEHILSKFPTILYNTNNTFELNFHDSIKELYNTIHKNKIPMHQFVNDKQMSFEKIQKMILNEASNNIEKDFLSVPIGKSADGRKLINFEMGLKSECFHAFITGLAGSGKTTLLNNIILGIAQKYTSKQIRLYLMDYKEGVEFQVFREHPNCEKIFLDNSDLSAATNLLENFVNTIEERGKLFAIHEAKDIIAFNEKNQKQSLPIIILIIDEVQRLFSGSWGEREHLSQLLKDVVRRGRAFGVHIILSTQTLAGTDIDKELMSQITLRISFKLSQNNDAEAIFGYNNNYTPLKLNKYELVYNKQSGQKDANIICKTTEPQDIKKTIKDVIEKRAPSLILKPEIVKSKIEKSTTDKKTVLSEPLQGWDLNIS